MSDIGDDEFKSLFDEDFDKAKGHKSAGLSETIQWSKLISALMLLRLLVKHS